jgi:hypothetical protein
VMSRDTVLILLTLVWLAILVAAFFFVLLK